MLRWCFIIKQSQKIRFFKGYKDGLPIAFGYLSVAFAFGMLAVKHNLPLWCPILISITNFTGTGQFVGVELMSTLATFTEIAFTVLIINLRYLLMSLSLSQKLSYKVNGWQRMLISFGNTDEIFGVSMQQNGYLKFDYMMGLILSSYTGWILGTTLGAFASASLPESLRVALGIAIYAMFIAILTPKATHSKPVGIIVVIAVVISAVCYWVPMFSGVSKGWAIIIAGVISSVVGAIFFPIKAEEEVDSDDD